MVAGPVLAILPGFQASEELGCCIELDQLRRNIGISTSDADTFGICAKEVVY